MSDLNRLQKKRKAKKKRRNIPLDAKGLGLENALHVGGVTVGGGHEGTRRGGQAVGYDDLLELVGEGVLYN